ncbi:MAG: asparagine synthase (glutamine-hydrolyzing) [Cyclobacteriaceae bacterium]|nr:asparagine synthase (glutamine-hydrolyzing) [Cyclobacteriaceae bacterium]
MCGIAGFCDFTKRTNEEIVKAMTDVIAYRGPDDEGRLFTALPEGNIGLGHKRLSILDLSPLGHQPYTFKGLQLIFNGEIYNFHEIRKKLQDKGYVFQSNSDTEVIIKAYDAYGMDCVQQFIGMFAFALLDIEKSKLFLVRDRAGVKPLYWYWKNDLFLFGSELKSFHLHPGFTKILNYDSLGLYFQYSYIPAPYSIYQDAYKVKPGYWVELDLKNKSIHHHQYWNVLAHYNKPKLSIGYNEAKAELTNLLLSSCEYRMIADVPVGLFLSGGYDSSAVAAILQSNRTEKLKTFTIGFTDKKFDEAPHAKKVAQQLGTDHTEYYCTHQEAFDIIPKLSFIYDEPFGDNSIIPTTLVSQLAIKQVKVALSADGGDEVFGGYPKFQMALNYTRKWPTWMSKVFATSMNLVNPDYIPFTHNLFNFSTRYNKIKSILAKGDPAHAMKIISQFNTDQELKKRFLFPYHPVTTDFDSADQLNEGNDDVNKMLAIDYRTFLVDNNLTKVDRATMSVSLEGREPLLDHRIIEFAARLPSAFKHTPGKSKIILKDIVHQYLPPAIMDRPKMGFIVPIMGWFKNELKDMILQYLDENRLKSDGLFNHREVIGLRNRYLAGHQENIQKIWHLLLFQMWKERWKI